MMVRVNPETLYLERKSRLGRGKFRDWYFVKYTSNWAIVGMGRISVSLPKKYARKRVRFKMEILED